jgi:hypothetical protein
LPRSISYTTLFWLMMKVITPDDRYTPRNAANLQNRCPLPPRFAPPLACPPLPMLVLPREEKLLAWPPWSKPLKAPDWTPL